jgi:iron complex outermembrane recepter protein
MNLKALILSFALVMSLSHAFSQATGSIRGVLKDKRSGEPLFGATVVIKGTTNGSTTDMDGKFLISGVNPGTYTLRVNFIGYGQLELPVTVTSGETNLGDVQMEEEAIGLEAVEVFASIVEERKSPMAISAITAQQLEERYGSMDLADAMQNTPGVYTIQGAGGYGDQEVYIRGFDQTNVAFLINGIPINDMENGRMFWSNFAGLNQVTRTIQVQRGLGASKLAVNSIGGTVNMITKPSDRREGGRLEYQMGTGTWNNRFRFTYNTGESANGWAFSMQGARTTTGGGLLGLPEDQQGPMVPGAFTDAWSYYVAISKKINSQHQIMFWAFGAPFNRGTAFVVDDQTREVFNITDPMANNALGIYRGSIFNARQNKVHKPMAAVTHYWDLDARTNITTSVYYSLARVYSVQPRDANSATFFADRSNPALIGREITHDNLINWDYLAEQNRLSARQVTVPYPNGNFNIESVTGYNSRYYLESRHNNHDWIGMVSNFSRIAGNMTYRAGVDLRHYRGEHYGQVFDLMGGDFILQQNRFGDAYNKLDTENAIGYVGDKTNYYYDGIVNWLSAFGQMEYTLGKWDYFGSLTVTQSDMQRVGYFWNGSTFSDFEQNSLGTSEKRNYLTYTFKAGANYRITGRHNVYANAGTFTRPPFLASAFRDSRYSNEYRQGLKAENVVSTEVGYGYRTGFLKVNVNGYYLLWKDRTTAFDQPNQGDEGPNFLALTLGGLVSEHKGLELDFVYSPITSLELNGFVGLGEWTWKKVPDQEVVLDDGSVQPITSLKPMEGLPVGTAAQTTVGVGFHFKGIRNTYLGGRLIYADRIPVTYSPEDIAQGFISKSVIRNDFDAYATLDVYAGRYFDMGRDLRGRFSVNVLNVTNNTYVRYASYFFNQVQRGYGFPRTFNIGFSIDF